MKITNNKETELKPKERFVALDDTDTVYLEDIYYSLSELESEVENSLIENGDTGHVVTIYKYVPIVTLEYKGIVKTKL